MDYNNYTTNNNDNYYIDNTQTVYNNTPNQFYNQPPQPPKMGMAIAALVIGILSMTLCCAGGTFLGIIGIILGIISLTKNYDGKGMAIAGIITSVLGVLIGIFMLFYLAIFVYAFNEGMSEYEDYLYEYEDYMYDYKDYISEPYIDSLIEDDEFDWGILYQTNAFSGHTFQASDGSVIYFKEDGTYFWYQSDDNHDDNYYSGSYSEYYKHSARDYIVNDLWEYAVTQEELDDYFERNEGDTFYNEENFCCLVLHNYVLIVNGESLLDYPYDSNYIGFYSNGIFDAANMDSGDYTLFTICE